MKATSIRSLVKEFGKHDTVRHSAKEYARGEVHTNTIENVFSVFKRGMVGVYQHCGEAHLRRYLAEFDFRYNRRTALKISDAERAEDLLRMARDKRLTYRRMVKPITLKQKARRLLWEIKKQKDLG